MKTTSFAEDMIDYQAPQVEVIEVEVEKGFAASTEPSNPEDSFN